MGSRTRPAWAGGFVVTAAGCRAEDAPGGLGTSTAGGVGAADHGFGLFLYERAPGVPGERGRPLAGVSVAVGWPSRARAHVVSDAAGKAHVVIPDGDGEVTITAARSGLLPITTFFRLTATDVDSVREAVGELHAVIEPQPWPEEEQTVTVTFRSLSNPGFCVSFGRGAECTAFSELAARQVQTTSAIAPFVAYALDGHGCAVRLLEGAIPDLLTGTRVELAFDASSSPPPERVTITPRIPDDPDSGLRTEALHPEHDLSASAADHRAVPAPIVDWTNVGLFYGGSCSEVKFADRATLRVDVVWFPSPSGHPLDFETLAFGQGAQDWGSWRTLAGEPLVAGGSYEVMDTPRLELSPNPPTLGSEASCPEVGGAMAYDFVVHDGAPLLGPAVWTVPSFRALRLAFPPLPDGYDPGADWSFGDPGEHSVIDCDGFIPWPSGGFACGSGLPAR